MKVMFINEFDLYTKIQENWDFLKIYICLSVILLKEATEKQNNLKTKILL